MVLALRSSLWLISGLKSVVTGRCRVCTYRTQLSWSVNSELWSSLSSTTVTWPRCLTRMTSATRPKKVIHCLDIIRIFIIVTWLSAVMLITNFTVADTRVTVPWRWYLCVTARGTSCWWVEVITLTGRAKKCVFIRQIRQRDRQRTDCRPIHTHNIKITEMHDNIEHSPERLTRHCEWHQIYDKTQIWIKYHRHSFIARPHAKQYGARYCYSTSVHPSVCLFVSNITLFCQNC